MKSNIEKVSQLERRLNIEIPANVVADHFDKVYKGIQRSANIKGFRPGKAPLATIKSVYGERVKNDVAQDLIQKHYFEAVKEHALEPINYPEFEFDVPGEQHDFSFSAHFEVRPEISLKTYEGLEVESEKYVPDEKRVEEVINNIRSSRAQLIEVTDGRPAQNGDTAVIDFEGFVDGQPLPGGSGTGHNLELGANQFIEGFEQGVVGMKVGDEKTLTLKFPDPYHSAELAGKPVEFKVKLTSLKRKDLPELTDEFVMGLGGIESVEKLKETIRADVEKSEKKRIEGDLRNRLLKALVKKNPVEVPPSMLKEQKQSLIEDMKRRMTEQGMGDEDFSDYATKWDADFNVTAAEMIQSSFLIDAIAKAKDLRWSQSDLDQKYAEYATQTGIDLERIKEFYTKPEQAQRLNYMITEEKVLEYLLKSAKVKEVDAAKLAESKN